MPLVHRLDAFAVPIAGRRRWWAFGWGLGRFVAQTVGRLSVDALFEERRRERERIARELHDTVLQGTQALLLSVQAIARRTAPDDPARALLDDALRRADDMMREGRDRIQNLRTTAAGVGLAQSLALAWKDLAGHTGFRILVEGAPRDLDPAVGDEIALIGREALSNALRHSRARLIEAQIVYDQDRLLLRIRDDGVGIGQCALGNGARSAHWGIEGMRERALCIQGRLGIWSAPGAGTEIELSVPAGWAYRCRAQQP